MCGIARDYDSKMNIVNEYKPPALIPPKTTITCKADTGATRSYLTEKDAKILCNKENLPNGPLVNLPDETSLQAKIKGKMKLKLAMLSRD